jgi:hypothetical protein
VVPDLVNTADRVMLPVLNPGCVHGLRSSVVTLQTGARRRQTAAFCWNCWLKLIPQHITVPSTAHECKVTAGWLMLRTVYSCGGFYLNGLCIYAWLLSSSFRNYVICRKKTPFSKGGKRKRNKGVNPLPTNVVYIWSS